MPRYYSRGGWNKKRTVQSPGTGSAVMLAYYGEIWSGKTACVIAWYRKDSDVLPVTGKYEAVVAGSQQKRYRRNLKRHL